MNSYKQHNRHHRHHHPCHYHCHCSYITILLKNLNHKGHDILLLCGQNNRLPLTETETRMHKHALALYISHLNCELKKKNKKIFFKYNKIFETYGYGYTTTIFILYSYMEIFLEDKRMHASIQIFLLFQNYQHHSLCMCELLVFAFSYRWNKYKYE